MQSVQAALLSILLCGVAGCASVDPMSSDGSGVPPGAVESTRTEGNGDVVTEFRVAGALRAVRVQPVRGPVYYLYDDNGDGRIDRNTGGKGPLTYYKLFGF